MFAPGALHTPAVSGQRHQRVNGYARLRFGRHGVSDLLQVAPARLMFPHERDGDYPLVVTIATSGGLTGGDRLAFDIEIEPGASATIVSQAAEKLYRALPQEEPTRIDTRLRLGARSNCEWLAQEAILFDRSRLRRSFDVDLADGARMLAMEMLTLGRGAMGERYAEGLIHDSWRIRRKGRLAWADTLRCEGDFEAEGRKPFGFGNARAIATLVYAGSDAALHLELARALVERPGGGATTFDDLLIVRMIHADPDTLRKQVAHVAGRLRAAIFGTSPAMPAVFHC